MTAADLIQVLGSLPPGKHIYVAGAHGPEAVAFVIDMKFSIIQPSGVAQHHGVGLLSEPQMERIVGDESTEIET